MTEIVIPSGLRVARSSFKYIDQTGVSRSVFSDSVQTTGYGGDRVGASIDFTPAGGASTADRSLRAQIKALLMSTRGKQNRIFTEDNSTTRRGSFPATELFTNTDFSSTSGWTSTSDYSISTADGTLIAKRIAVTGAPDALVNSSGVTVTQYAPYVLRYLVGQGRGAYGTTFQLRLGATSGAATYGSLTAQTYGGYKVLAAVPYGTTVFGTLQDGASSGVQFSDYFTVNVASLSRCALSDLGTNLLIRSDEISNATGWPTLLNATMTADQSNSPDGTMTADQLNETTTNGLHYVRSAAVTVASTALDYTFTCAVRQSNRTWCVLEIFENTGSTACYMFFNLSGVVLGSSGVDTNWASVRGSIVDAGNSWRICTITARKTNAATSLTAHIGSANADNGDTYAGVGTQSALLLWRATLAQSSVAVRLSATTSVATTGNTSTGSGIYVKGLPASSSGLLLSGDWVEIDDQLKMVMASLDSDAAGLGYLQFSPPLRRAVSDNTPIIVNRPMGRFILAGDAMWNNVPGVFSEASIELEEAWS